MACALDSDCAAKPYSDCREGLCVHKHVYPFLSEEIVGIITLPFLLGLANIGGIGGGGLIVPISIALFGFNPREAVGVSRSTIFFGSMTRFLMFSLRERHPHKDATVIDYSLASIMIPCVLLGGYIGALFNVIFPQAVLSIMMTLLLVYVTFESFSKAVTLFRSETITKQLHYSKMVDNPKILPQTLKSPSSKQSSSQCNSTKKAVKHQ